MLSFIPQLMIQIPSEQVALLGNFDTTAVRVQNGCKRVHLGAVCAGFYSDGKHFSAAVIAISLS